MYRKRPTEDGVPTHVVKLDYSKLDINSFFDFAAQDPVVAAAHPMPPDSGSEHFYKAFRDISASNPRVLSNIMYKYWAFENRDDPLVQAFPGRQIESTVQRIQTTRVTIDPHMAEASVRGTPARIISSTSESDNTVMLYYAQGVKFDRYAVEEDDGATMFGLQVMNLIANMHAAINHHIVSVAIQTTPSFYFSAEQISPSLRVPQTETEFVYLWRQLVNIFGKPQKTMSTILRMHADVMARQNQRPDRIIVPSSKFNVLFGGDRGRFLYVNSGGEAAQKQNESTGAVLPGQVMNLLGLEAITTVACELNSGYGESARVLTSSDFRTGSIFVHLKQFSMLQLVDQRAIFDEVASPSWYTNQDDHYPYFNTVANDISIIQPGETGPSGPVWKGLEGLPNRPLLSAFTGMEGGFKDSDDRQRKASASLDKIRREFVNRRIVPPGDPDDQTQLKRWKTVSPLLAWNPNLKCLYPALTLGEMPDFLEADKRDMELFMYMFESKLFEGVAFDYDSGDPSDMEKFWVNFSKLTWAHPKLLEKNNETPEYGDEIKDQAHRFDEKESWKAATEEYEKFRKNHPRSSEETAIAAAVKVMSYHTEYDDMYKQVEEKYSTLSSRSKYANDILFRQPIGAPFFKKCRDNNIFVPFSGVIVRLSEKSEATTPVLLASGKIGESYVQPRGELMSLAQESKQGILEMGVHVGARIVDNTKFMPMPFAITGAVNVSSGGSGDKFMVEHAEVQNALGSTYEERMNNIALGHANPAMKALREKLLNRPENCGRYTNLAIFQGNKCSKQGGFPQVIDITGRFHARSFVPFISAGHPVLMERGEQLFPGSVFHAWALDADKVFRVRPDGDMQIVPEKMSYIEIAETRRNNTVAALADSLHFNRFGIPERRQGIHVRGERIPGKMREQDECNVYATN